MNIFRMVSHAMKVKVIVIKAIVRLQTYNVKVSGGLELSQQIHFVTRTTWRETKWGIVDILVNIRSVS